ncbi:MAG TPA: M67 family metallopeptidase [Trueperaceae bacterium]
MRRGVDGWRMNGRPPVLEPGELRVDRAVLHGMLAHARQDAPRECVGLLFGQGGRIRRRVPLPNAAPEPERHYYAEPVALLRAFRAAEARGEEHLGIYHSHPHGPDTLSRTDLAEAHYAVPAFLVLPLPGRVRAFCIAGNACTEVSFRVEEQAEPTSSKADGVVD